MSLRHPLIETIEGLQQVVAILEGHGGTWPQEDLIDLMVHAWDSNRIQRKTGLQVGFCDAGCTVKQEVW